MVYFDTEEDDYPLTDEDISVMFTEDNSLYEEYKRGRTREEQNKRLKNNLRSRVRTALKGNSKSASTMELVGCTIGELKEYLELQFTKGMTWSNYGEWHIDHIIPLSVFDLTDEEQLRAAMNYENLQPLWAINNIKKGAKYKDKELIAYLTKAKEQ